MFSFQAEFQIVAGTASTLEEPSLILVNKLQISIASILLASNCLRNRVTQFETLIVMFSGVWGTNIYNYCIRHVTKPQSFDFVQRIWVKCSQIDTKFPQSVRISADSVHMSAPFFHFWNIAAQNMGYQDWFHKAVPLGSLSMTRGKYNDPFFKTGQY